MKDKNQTMVTISWVVTILFGILLIISWVNAAQIQTPYGSPATSPPYIFGVLVANSIIPGILWLITYYTKSSNDDSKNKTQNLKADNTGYKGGYGGGHNQTESKSDDYSGGYSGGHNQTSSHPDKKAEGYNSGDLYN